MKPLNVLLALSSALFFVAASYAQPASDHVATAKQFLSALESKDAKAIDTLLTDDIRVEQPFALPGAVAQMNGRAQVGAYFNEIFGRFSQIRFQDIRAVPSRNANSVYLEMRGDFLTAEGKQPYRNNYIVRFGFDQGRIRLVREQYNPLLIALTFNAPLEQVLANTVQPASISEKTKLPTTANARLIERFLGAVEREDLKTLENLIANDMVISAPYALPQPTRYDGKAASVEYLKTVFSNLRNIKFAITYFGETPEGRSVYLELQGNNDMTVQQNGKGYRNVYAMMFDLENNRIKALREYFNPFILARAFDIPIPALQQFPK